ncbi:ABC transporter permease [Mesorhizobium shangrilense]|uniref:Iron ABC transporter permease n=1 Tax=Mesorhizobium shangrilense TaxID=460060 RepID=A0ABV2D5Z2_9HYPH
MSALVSIVVLVPLGFSLVRALSVAPAKAAALIFRPIVGELLINTVAIVVATTLVCGLVGLFAAWTVERHDFSGRSLLATLFAVPLAIPAFITSYAWVSISPLFEQFGGALVVLSCSYFPFVYLPVAAALRGLDPTLEESAGVLGVGRWGVFARVVLPQLRPALFGGMLLVALNTLVEFGAFTLLRFRTFTTQIFAEYKTGFNGPEASLLAVILIALCLVCLLLEAMLRGRTRYARVGRGGRRAMRTRLAGWTKPPILAACCLLVLMTIGVPFGMIAFWLMQHNSAAISPVIASPELLAGATLSSIAYGVAGAALTLLLAAPLAFLASRYRGPLVTVIERAAYLAQGVPGIVIALSLISLTVHNLRPIYQTSFLLLLAYAILFLPLAIVSMRATFAQLRPSLEDAGRSLGLSRWGVALRIVVPLAAPGIGSAAALVFISITTELTATLLLAPIGVHTLATQIWADTSTLAFAAAAPYAALMTGLSLLSTFLLTRQFGRLAVTATE